MKTVSLDSPDQITGEMVARARQIVVQEDGVYVIVRKARQLPAGVEPMDLHILVDVLDKRSFDAVRGKLFQLGVRDLEPCPDGL